MNEINPDRLMRRRDLAIALRERGFPITVATLATMATRGGGPPYRTFGRVPLYRLGDALAWAERKLSAPRGSTSEAAARRPAPARPAADELFATTT